MISQVIKHNMNKNIFPVLNTLTRINKDMQDLLILKMASIL